MTTLLPYEFLIKGLLDRGFRRAR